MCCWQRYNEEGQAGKTKEMLHVGEGRCIIMATAILHKEETKKPLSTVICDLG